MKRSLNIAEFNHSWRIVPDLLLDTVRHRYLFSFIKCLPASETEAGITSGVDAWGRWPGLPPLSPVPGGSLARLAQTQV